MYKRFRCVRKSEDFVTVKTVDFTSKTYTGVAYIGLYECDEGDYDVVLPLVDMYFNGMLLRAGVYYHDPKYFITRQPIVELA